MQYNNNDDALQRCEEDREKEKTDPDYCEDCTFQPDCDCDDCIIGRANEK